MKTIATNFGWRHTGSHVTTVLVKNYDYSRSTMQSRVCVMVSLLSRAEPGGQGVPRRSLGTSESDGKNNCRRCEAFVSHHYELAAAGDAVMLTIWPVACSTAWQRTTWPSRFSGSGEMRLQTSIATGQRG